MVSASNDLFLCGKRDLKNALYTPCVTEEQTCGLKEKQKSAQPKRAKKVEIRTLMNLASIDIKSYLRILILKSPG